MEAASCTELVVSTTFRNPVSAYVPLFVTKIEQKSHDVTLKFEAMHKPTNIRGFKISSGVDQSAYCTDADGQARTTA